MNAMGNSFSRLAGWRSARLTLGSALLALAAGCPVGPGPGDGDDGDTGPPDGGTVTVSIRNITTSFSMSALEPTPLAVLYTATGTPDSLEGFFVPVADSSLNAAPIGERVTVAVSLPVGANQAFNFEPATAGVGFFRVGVVATVAGVETQALSTGAVQVQAPPDPQFVQIEGRLPTEIVEATAGQILFVTFDAGDPEGEVQWRVFFLSESDDPNVTPDLLGTQIAVGSGNVGQVTFDTTDLDPGDYELGIAATDSGRSVASTVAVGDAALIVTIPTATTTGPIVRIIP